MSNIIKKQEDSTAVITDIRRFSETFKLFQNRNDDRFLQFIESYYNVQNSIASIVSDRVHMSSTGDGVLAIFMNEKHYRSAYAYIIASHRALTNLCLKFMEEHKETKISFGIGADSGHVWNVGQGKLNTYVGTVINRASRIEAHTKMFAETTTSIGNSLYRKLLKDFYPASYDLMNEYENYRVLLNENPEVVLVSSQLLLQYIHEMELKGIQNNAPIFRLDDLLAEEDSKFWKVMNKLLTKEESQNIEFLLGDI
jgi:class 3 adenylate cyclase